MVSATLAAWAPHTAPASTRVAWHECGSCPEREHTPPLGTSGPGARRGRRGGEQPKDSSERSGARTSRRARCGHVWGWHTAQPRMAHGLPARPRPAPRCGSACRAWRSHACAPTRRWQSPAGQTPAATTTARPRPQGARLSGSAQPEPEPSCRTVTWRCSRLQRSWRGRMGAHALHAVPPRLWLGGSYKVCYNISSMRV